MFFFGGPDPHGVGPRDSRAIVLSHDLLSFFVRRKRRLVVLELSSFLPSRAYSVSEFLEALFSSKIILLISETVLFEIQYIRDGRPPIPIFEHELVAEAH